MTFPAARQARQSQAGVTLVEVLAVLVIIALATSLVVPRIISNSNARNLDRSAERLVLDLRRANTEARLEGRPVVITILEDGYAVEGGEVRRSWDPSVTASWQRRGRGGWREVSRLTLSGRSLGREEVRIRIRRDEAYRDIRIEPLTGRVDLVTD